MFHLLFQSSTYSLLGCATTLGILIEYFRTDDKFFHQYYLIMVDLVDLLLRSGRASITTDTAIRIDLHSAEVVHFTHTMKQPVHIPRKSASGGPALLQQDLPDL